MNLTSLNSNNDNTKNNLFTDIRFNQLWDGVLYKNGSGVRDVVRNSRRIFPFNELIVCRLVLTGSIKT